MPWTGSSFRSRHNHDLSPEQAKKAAAMANALLKKGMDEGEAIAIANKHAKGKRKSSADRQAGRYGK